ncbi:hypothetical protein Rsub_07007 [Raphidocelis subcapitata]|uniref:Uncharacterized protein n=1 Tax=Raphidocelis subcapitata TaxID=307507 RepID=A0A2V0P9A2_9CHLO|nr:hypothetical protein Rsub_07007 [Raphidocelis subcapitata]|eukprot:GBF94473.1 hypothetical protein Rsub_07007 [Raphidocelis subcapitata]
MAAPGLTRGAAAARGLCAQAAWAAGGGAAAAGGGTPAALQSLPPGGAHAAALLRFRAGAGPSHGTRGAHSDAAAAGDGDRQPSPSGGGGGDGGFETVYEGLFAANHKRLKLASLVNTAVSLAACPAIVLLSDAPPLARAAVAVSVVGFGLGTTLGLHWFTSPYVHVLARRGDALRARTLTLLGRPRWSEFSLAEVRHPDSLRPLASFKARGRFFYVDRGAMADAELAAALSPVSAAEEAALQQQAEAAAEAEAAARAEGEAEREAERGQAK